MAGTLLLLPIDRNEIEETRNATDRLIRQYVAYMGRASAVGLCTCQVTGNSMGATLKHGDWLIIDALCHPANGEVIVATLDGRYVVKRLLRDEHHTMLLSDNRDFPNIDVTPFRSFAVIGTVKAVVREVA